jgi:hypothetical protein
VTDALLALALVGSRASGFNHDCASKLQSLMMALDEIAELADASRNTELIRAADTATGSLRELNTLLNGNRALTKAPVRTATPLRELFAKAAERVSSRVEGEVPERTVEVALPAMTHALSLLFDLAAEMGPRGRMVMIANGIVRASKQPSPEVLAIASFAIARDGGTLAVVPDGFALSFG